MKTIFLGLLLMIGISAIVSSCNDDLNLVGDFVETPVVIGILNQAETTHFVKVTRTFIGDGETSSLAIAQNPDSSYFNQVDITVQEILSNGSNGRTFNLHDTIIENKDVNGAFYAPEQKVYVFYTPEDSPLIDNARYAITINIDNGRIVVTGETELVNGLNLANTLIGNNKPLRFTDSGTSLGVYQSQAITVDQVGNARKLNAKIRIDYREYLTPTDSIDKSILWNLGDADLALGTNSHVFVAEGTSFYNLIKSNIAVDPSLDKRRLVGVELLVTGASEDLASYIEVNQPSSNLAQNKPEYTNLDVTEGFKVIGVFTSRFTFKEYKFAVGGISQIRAIDKKSLRELCQGPITGTLGFCSNHQADADFGGFYCP